MAKAPTSRGFTLAEKRSLTFERVALYMVLFVAVVATVISFVALRWLADQMGLGWASSLVPLAIDGFAIACSVGIVRSQAAGEPAKERVSEWTGLALALGLSIVGNVHHVLETGRESLPVWIAGPFAAAIPMIVAYGIHVYGRAMARGISARVMADSPDELRLDIDSAHAQTAPGAQQRARTPRIEKAPAVRASVQEPVRAVEAARAPERADEDVRAPRAPMAVHAGPEQDEREATPEQRARAVFDELYASDPTRKPDASRVHAQAGLTHNSSTTRRWVIRWWDEVGGDDSEDIARDAAPAVEDAQEVARAS